MEKGNPDHSFILARESTSTHSPGEDTVSLTLPEQNHQPGLGAGDTGRAVGRQELCLASSQPHSLGTELSSHGERRRGVRTAMVPMLPTLNSY